MVISAAGHAAGPPAGAGFLDVDAPVGLGEERPGQAVEQDADAGEEGEDDEDAADNQRIDAHPVCDAAGDAADPPVTSALDAVAPDPGEEVTGLAGALALAYGPAYWPGRPA